MKLHANASLTVQQRTEVRRLHVEEHVPIRELARRFPSRSRNTVGFYIRRWAPDAEHD
jgi:hypothetical protein